MLRYVTLRYVTLRYVTYIYIYLFLTADRQLSGVTVPHKADVPSATPQSGTSAASFPDIITTYVSSAEVKSMRAFIGPGHMPEDSIITPASTSQSTQSLPREMRHEIDTLYVTSDMQYSAGGDSNVGDVHYGYVGRQTAKSDTTSDESSDDEVMDHLPQYKALDQTRADEVTQDEHYQPTNILLHAPVEVSHPTDSQSLVPEESDIAVMKPTGTLDQSQQSKSFDSQYVDQEVFSKQYEDAEHNVTLQYEDIQQPRIDEPIKHGGLILEQSLKAVANPISTLEQSQRSKSLDSQYVDKDTENKATKQHKRICASLSLSDHLTSVKSKLQRAHIDEAIKQGGFYTPTITRS